LTAWHLQLGYRYEIGFDFQNELILAASLEVSCPFFGERLNQPLRNENVLWFSLCGGSAHSLLLPLLALALLMGPLPLLTAELIAAVLPDKDLLMATLPALPASAAEPFRGWCLYR